MNETPAILEDAINFYHNNFSVEWDEETKNSLYNFLNYNNFSDNEILISGLCAKKNNKFEDRITETTINELKIGYANTDIQELYYFLKTKGYCDDDIVLSGLCYREDGLIKDSFFRSIVFPVYNYKKELLVLISKRIDKAFNQNTYKVLFNYEYENAKNEFLCFEYDGDKRNYVMICDNFFDLIYLYNSYIKNAVCYFEDELKLTVEQCSVLRMSGNNVSLKIDSLYLRESTKEKLKKYGATVL